MRKKRKKTERERQMVMSQKRERHELKKKRKAQGHPDTTRIDGFGLEVVNPHIEAMFRKKSVKKTAKEIEKDKLAYKKTVKERRDAKRT